MRSLAAVSLIVLLSVSQLVPEQVPSAAASWPQWGGVNRDFVVADGEYLKRPDVEAAGFRAVDLIVEPDRLYHRIISSRPVMGMLGWVRDPKRLALLQRGTRRTLTIYYANSAR